jgi:hypothetical protein
MPNFQSQSEISISFKLQLKSRIWIQKVKLRIIVKFVLEITKY